MGALHHKRTFATPVDGPVRGERSRRFPRVAVGAGAILRMLGLGALGAGFAACAGEIPDEAPVAETVPSLGPVDGSDLPGIDLERIRVGDQAPDFTLASFDGDPVTLSDFRGSSNVLLVFYRGHW